MNEEAVLNRRDNGTPDSAQAEGKSAPNSRMWKMRTAQVSLQKDRYKTFVHLRVQFGFDGPFERLYVLRGD